MDRKTVFDSLFKSLDESTTRTRQVLLIQSVACIIVFSAIYNGYFTWIRHINAVERPDFPIAKDIVYPNSRLDDLTSDTITYEKFDFIYAEFTRLLFERETLSIPLVGIKVYCSDLQIIGGCSFLLLLSWSFFAIRRENKILFSIKKKLDQELKLKSGNPTEVQNFKEWVFYSTANSFLFETSSNDDFVNLQDYSTNRLGRFVFYFISLCPVVLLIAIFFTDIMDIIGLLSNSSPLPTGVIIELILRLLASPVFILLCAYQTFYIHKLSKDNTSQLQDIRALCT